MKIYCGENLKKAFLIGHDVMKFKVRNVKLPVTNFDKLARSSEHEKRRHGALLPHSLRAIFCGPSNCGKTNALLTLIVHSNGLKFENIYVWSKSLHQDKYEFLRKVIENVEGVHYYPYSEHEEVVRPEDAKPQSIMIFDDVACEKQDNMRAYFCMGRHRDIDSVYLCQTYSRIPKHLVRDNANFLVIFRQDEMNLKHIYDDHVNTDMRFNQFRDLCIACWRDKYGFLVIDKDSDKNSGRYRKNFDCFVSIN